MPVVFLQPCVTLHTGVTQRKSCWVTLETTDVQIDDRLLQDDSIVYARVC